MVLVAIRSGARCRHLLGSSTPMTRVRAYASRDTGSVLLAVWPRDRMALDRARALASSDVAVLEPARWPDAARDRLRDLIGSLDHVGAYATIADAVAAARDGIAARLAA
jgi:hypothetical protein